jgi:hypothetical protein
LELSATMDSREEDIDEAAAAEASASAEAVCDGDACATPAPASPDPADGPVPAPVPVPASRRRLGSLLTPSGGSVDDGDGARSAAPCRPPPLAALAEPPRTGLTWRAESLPACGLPVNCTVDPSSETAAPIGRCNAFSPSFRATKVMFSRREPVYRRPSGDPPDDAAASLPAPAPADKADKVWRVPEQAVAQIRVRNAGGGDSPMHAPVSSPQAPRKQRNSISFGSSVGDSDSRDPQPVLFDSNFECGNLLRADRILRQNPLSSASTASTSSADFRVQPLEEYLLHMEEEPNRKNGCQWFFFRTKHLDKRKRYSFSLCNFYKSKASFTKGMRPVFFSSIANALDKKHGWKRIGDDIAYKKNPSAPLSVPAGAGAGAGAGGAAEPPSPSSQYTLSFTFDVPYDHDICYFAFSVPYSLTRLQKQIEQWMQDEYASKHLEVFRMCRTVAGNVCPLLRITDHRSDYIPLAVMPWERERVQRQQSAEKAAEKARRQAEQARRREEEARAREEQAAEEERLEKDRVFFVGKQKMHMSLGVLDWEQELDENETPPDTQTHRGTDTQRYWQDDNADADADAAARSPAAEGGAREGGGEGPLGAPAGPGPGPGSGEDATEHPPSPCRVLRSKKVKPVVVVSARVHPGETVSSFMCEGLVRYLLSDAPSAVQLRERCVFIVVPMLNPDGVVNGFYRTNLTGTDLNRCWDRPSEVHQPTVCALKAIISDMQKTDRIISYFDFHGHSHKKGVFFYGTRMYPSYASVYNQVVHGGYESPYASLSLGDGSISSSSSRAAGGSKGDPEARPKSPSPAAMLAWKPYQSVSPVELVLAVGSATRLVNLKHCTAAFPRVARFQGVARYVVSEELEVPVSFTVEASFHAGAHGPYKRRHFRSDDYFRYVARHWGWGQSWYCIALYSLFVFLAVGLAVPSAFVYIK